AGQPAPQNLAQAPLPPPEPVALQPAPALAEPAPPEPAQSDPAPEVAAAEPAPPTAAAGEKTLALRFRGESWVEIRDRAGQVLMSKLNAAGGSVVVTGRPPLALVIGNAAEVSLEVDGRAYPLEPETRTGVARFTLR
ncbi:MAG TPA: DUF4115 domain-containing protein, partial [Myxococcota bacterium]|nr:DUF4115 domain-containing protein [Myxococcota bacterium]